MEETVTITKKEYLELAAASLCLLALERGGVDNWSWYGESISYFIKEWNENNGTDFSDLEQIAAYSIENSEF